MPGILNHPKMPVVAGSLALALLAGGIYSSIDADAPVSAAVKKIRVENSTNLALADTTPQTIVARAQPATPAAVPVVAASSPSALVQVDTTVAGAQLATSASTFAQKATSTQIQPVQAIRPVQTALAQPPRPATRPILDPVMPPPSVTPAPTAAPVVVVVPPVAKVVIADEAPVQSVAAAQPVAVAATVDVSHPSSQPAKPAVVQTTKKKKKHRVAREEEGDNTDTSDAAAKKPVEAATKTEQTQNEYTEIKGAATPQTLAAPATAPAPVAPTAVRKQVEDTFRPTVVALAGGQAWVKISPERTIAVKSGDSVPGLGTVTSVTGNSVETDKGKFSLNTKE